MKKFKLYILVIFVSMIVVVLAGCGTIEGLRKDIRIVGKILSKV